MKQEDMKFGTKIALGMGGLAAALVLTAGYGLYTISGFHDAFERTAGKTAKGVELAGALNTAVANMAAGQRGTILYAYAKDPARMAAAQQLFEENSAIVRGKLSDLRPLLTTGNGGRIASHFEAGLSAWLARYGELERLAAAGDPDKAVRFFSEQVAPLRVAASEDSKELAALAIEILEVDRRAAQDDYAAGWRITLGLILLGAIAGASSVVVVRSATSAIRQVAAEISQGSQHVAAASGQVASASQSLAQGTSQQAATLEETSSSTTEITAVTRKNAENTRSVAALMVGAAQLVAEANHNLGEMVHSMTEINSSSEKISRINRVIDEIAFQTNILALNAAVEAARAGEAGMGFSVVADEVRNLAQRSAQAARDTAALIEDSIGRTGDGARKLDQVAGSIQQITASAKAVKALVDEIEAGSQEQSRGIEQIAVAMRQMEQVTQRSAASAEESAAASDELAAQARSLYSIVQRLRVLAGGEARKDESISAAPVAAGRPPGPAQARERSSFPLDDSERGG
ncbi:MAG TPA: methyl-accepting chemotaxis protein [Bryobacteraceae bacterium]|nr:methyl-accepting chemotaxis protein [Bryobacteraceae bacterium]